jgi:predicted enzyme related to lactoylglutathione lyase
VLTNEGGDPEDTSVDDGDVFWLDLFARDPAKAAAFYAEIGGYDIEAGEIAGRKRTQLATSGIARAGIASLPKDADRPGWLPYILVSDVRATVAKARAAGGKIVLEPRADLLGGNLAVIADPAGGVTGIVNWMGP